MPEEKKAELLDNPSMELPDQSEARKKYEDQAKRLADLNASRFAKPEPEPLVEKPEEEPKVEPKAVAGEPSKEEPGSKELEGGVPWIPGFEDKFRQDEKGITDLVKMAKHLQGEKDTTEAEMTRLKTKFSRALELDDLLTRRPDLAEAMLKAEKEKSKPAEELNPPELPKDADGYDLLTSGTEANKWFLAMLEYNRKLGAREVVDELENFRNEQFVANDERKERDEFRKMGLSDSDIDKLYRDMKNPELMTTENLVKTWKFLNGEEIPSGKAKTSKEVKPKDRPVSAVATSGKTPEPPGEPEKVKQAVKDGIMRHSTSGGMPDPFAS